MYKNCTINNSNLTIFTENFEKGKKYSLVKEAAYSFAKGAILYGSIFGILSIPKQSYKYWYLWGIHSCLTHVGLTLIRTARHNYIERKIEDERTLTQFGEIDEVTDSNLNVSNRLLKKKAKECKKLISLIQSKKTYTTEDGEKVLDEETKGKMIKDIQEFALNNDTTHELYTDSVSYQGKRTLSKMYCLNLNDQRKIDIVVKDDYEGYGSIHYKHIRSIDEMINIYVDIVNKREKEKTKKRS